MKNKFIISIVLVLFLPYCIFSVDILLINSQEAEPYTTVCEIMFEKLTDSGYIEGENLNVKRWNLGNNDGIATRAWMTERENEYDVILLIGTVAVINFKKFAMGDDRYKFIYGVVTDPVGIGVIDNFSDSPISNFTGVSYLVKIQDRLNFIRQIMPEARKIGLIYADMPQSHSYRKWMEETLETDEFSDLEVIYRKVEFVPGERGHIRMSMLAEDLIRELDPLVDLYISPNDQMGIQPEFAKAVYNIATKPLVGLGKKDVMNNWGAALSIYPDLDKMGMQIAQMVRQVLEGKEIKEIIPQWTEAGIAFDLKKTKRFQINIPEDLLIESGDNIIR